LKINLYMCNYISRNLDVRFKLRNLNNKTKINVLFRNYNQLTVNCAEPIPRCPFEWALHYLIELFVVLQVRN